MPDEGARVRFWVSSFWPMCGAVITTYGVDRVADVTTYCVILGDVGTINGDPIADPTGCGKLYLPAC